MQKVCAIHHSIRKWYNFIQTVVMITSNWDGNQEMMQGCKQRGIPAFGKPEIAISADKISNFFCRHPVGFLNCY